MGNFPVNDLPLRFAFERERGLQPASTVVTNVAVFAWFEIPCPGGAFENSPAFQRRDLCADYIRPGGTAEIHRKILDWTRPECANSAVPVGLSDLGFCYPALKRRAIVMKSLRDNDSLSDCEDGCSEKDFGPVQRLATPTNYSRDASVLASKRRERRAPRRLLQMRIKIQ